VLADEPLVDIPNGFPQVDFPEDNALTPERWALGKRLFYDPILSADSTLSCASCHRPELAFTDGRAIASGIEGRPGTRNTPTLTNVAYQPYFLREGGVPTLEMQVLVPIQEHAEFDFNILRVADRMSRDPEYVAASLEAYDRLPDPFVITRAIATFERSMISGESRYDAYVHGDHNALTDLEKEGMNLFFSQRTQCATCHSGFNFTDYSFQNNGLYAEYVDPGRFRLTGLESDRALFKVPTLRNIAYTAPYMHDGSISTLEDVVVHYNTGGKNHPHQSSRIHPLHLEQREQYALQKFLEALSDVSFLTEPKFRNP
jgi:cytochrome c peroxidase